ncbi:MAG: hypothetical protein E6Q66_02930 [Pedobacter sp.]|nr:MAG: hypothetical protein E6Q66_02930 [Pedobacter sp.]
MCTCTRTTENSSTAIRASKTAPSCTCQTTTTSIPTTRRCWRIFLTPQITHQHHK